MNEYLIVIGDREIKVKANYMELIKDCLLFEQRDEEKSTVIAIFSKFDYLIKIDNVLGSNET